jgi:hypothetical protein
MTDDWLDQLHGPGYEWTESTVQPATEHEIATLRAYSPRPLPEDYVAFQRRYGGGEIRYEGLWLIFITPAVEVAQWHEGYGFANYMPEALLFGNDGGGEGLVFDMRAHHPDSQYPILAVNYVTVGWNETIHVAGSFRELMLLRHELLEGAQDVD